MRLAVLAALLLIAAWTTVAAEESQRTLSFEDRVKAQDAIERVHYSHQIGATKPFEQAVPRAVLEGKVRKYLAKTAALKVYWKTAVTDEMLRRELERMAQGTKMPERLLELYAALANDPFLLKECLARATLVDRLTHNFYTFDPTLHAERRRAEVLHRQLSSGELSATVDHPNRSLVTLTMSDSEADRPTPNNRAELAVNRKQPFEEPLSPADFRKQRARFPESVGQVSALRDEPDAFVFSIVLDSTARDVRVANYVIPKTNWDDWWVIAEQTIRSETTAPIAIDRGPLPLPASPRSLNGVPCVPDDTWDNGILDDEPEVSSRYPMVWTGSELIAWGPPTGGHSGFGRRYDPATDTWTRTSLVNAPTGRTDHTAVWTGTSMVVWGGNSPPGNGFHTFNDGGRYDPSTDSWTPISMLGAPSARTGHTAVFTGDSMVVWGGEDESGYVGTGGRYDPVADTWLDTAAAGAPSGRSGHSAIWTGSSMVIWGGNDGPDWLGTGGKYDPATDTWTATSNVGAPCGRRFHTAIWTGSSMVVWGGQACDDNRGSRDGGRYDPATDTWTATSTTGAPELRYDHTAIWTGDRMVVWGGRGYLHGSRVELNTGGRYDPTTDTWTPTTTIAAPSARTRHNAVWTSSLMIVWGGSDDDTGGRYDPATDSWTPTSLPTMAAPSPRFAHTAVWTGSEMVVWGGRGRNSWPNEGGRYDPATDSWTPTSTAGAPLGRYFHTAVWTGSLMVIWGGYPPEIGGRYDPTTDTWTPTSNVGAPSARSSHRAIWTGSLMIVWGGSNADGTFPGDGGRYDPASDTWTPMSMTGAPPPAENGHSVVWTGNLMVVWGGVRGSATNTGGRYDPATDTWTATSTIGAPSVRSGHAAAWVGDLMIVWGGYGVNSYLDTGGRYDPANDSWTPTSTTGALQARTAPSAISTGALMVVWGGVSDSAPASSGSRYNPLTDSWTATSTIGEPSARYYHSAIWTGSEMIIWGGLVTINDAANTGGQYVLGASIDNDGDGYSVCQGDCDDTDPAIHPGATESCNGFDDNCDGQVDEGGDALCDDHDVCTGDTCHGAAACVNLPQDHDHDGVCDASDHCPATLLTPTVVIDTCNSGVRNYLLADGCNFGDEIAACRADRNNHGQFVSCVAHLAHTWKGAGLITGQQGSRIVRCAAQSR